MLVAPGPRKEPKKLWPETNQKQHEAEDYRLKR